MNTLGEEQVTVIINKYYLGNMWTTSTTYGDDIEIIYHITE